MALNCVILAGGNGSRFIEEGTDTPKPLIPILGQPMIERLINIVQPFIDGRITVAANPQMTELTRHLAALSATQHNIDIIVAGHHNSFVNLYEASKHLGGRFIAITCDSVFLPSEFGRFCLEFTTLSDADILMGVTRHVDDESPLYAKLQPDGRIVDYRYGGTPFKGDIFISAGVYGLSNKAYENINSSSLPQSLSDFQQRLAHDKRFFLRSFVFSKAFDVDNGHDRLQAEQFLQRAGN